MYFRLTVRLLVKEHAHLKMNSSVAHISTWAHQPDQIIIVSCIIWITGHCQTAFHHSSTAKLLWLETGQDSENITRTDVKVSALFACCSFYHETWMWHFLFFFYNFVLLLNFGLKNHNGAHLYTIDFDFNCCSKLIEN